MTVILNDPDNSTWWTDSSSVDHNWTVWTNGSTESIEWCALYNNKTGTFQLDANYTSGILNGTPFVRGTSYFDSVGKTYIWNVTCYNGTNRFESVGNRRALGVDVTTPTITLDSPSDDSFTSEDTLRIKYTPTDVSNPETCLLYTNLSGIWGINQTNTSYRSGTQIFYNISANSTHADGNYIWNVQCNDTAMNSAWAEDTNRTFTVDSNSTGLLVAINSPINNTVDSDTTPEITWNISSESQARFDEYLIIVSTNLTTFGAGIIQTQSITTVSTVKINLSELPVNDQYYFKITATDKAGNTQNSTNITWYAVDTAIPVVVLNFPSVNNSNTSDNTPEFNITVTDDNPDTCVLLLSNITGISLSINVTDTSITSGVVNTIIPTTMADGEYNFMIECNDSNNNRVNATSTPYEITIDTTNPTDIYINSTWHQTNTTDGTPRLSWNITTDINFQRYYIEARNVSDGNIDYAVNVTSRTTTYAELNLTFSQTYNFTVTAYDHAGNSFITPNATDTWLYLDDVCANLQAGWNLCGLVATIARNLSVIGAESGASFVSIWNTSKEWKTCNVVVGTTNCNLSVGITPTDTHHVWLYMDNAGLWENRTWNATSTSANTTLNNVTTNGWNIFSMYIRNGLTFGQLNDTSRFSNINVTGYSLPYNNATLSTPYITLDGFNTINQRTKFNYGKAMWVFFNGSTNASTHTFGTDGW